tara:strand:+ start:441 stop:677 length:237 start_codon:yes stop_codon:yes gene_type:complete
MNDEKLKAALATLKAIAEGEVTPEEASILCKSARSILLGLQPLIAEHRLSWILRASLYGVCHALSESSIYFEELVENE